MLVNQFGIQGLAGNVQLSKGGARLLNTSGVIEAKNAANNAYAVVRGANAVSGNDLVTFAQLPGVTGSINSRALSLVFGDAGTVNIGAELPALATVVGVLVNVSTVFDGATPATLAIGVAGTTGQLLATTEIDLATVEVYGGFVFKTYTPATQLIATLVVGATPSTGACEIIVLFANA